MADEQTQSDPAAGDLPRRIEAPEVVVRGRAFLDSARAHAVAIRTLAERLDVRHRPDAELLLAIIEEYADQLEALLPPPRIPR